MNSGNIIKINRTTDFCERRKLKLLISIQFYTAMEILKSFLKMKISIGFDNILDFQSSI